MSAVVVTGASTGIGSGCVKVMIARGLRVFGSVRKQQDAERLSNEFGANFSPLIFDVTDAAAVAAAASQVEAALGGETLMGLVNNAGIAVPGPLLWVTIEEFTRQISVNLTGQLIVTQAFAPLLGTERGRRGKPGRIVMIAAGKKGLPPERIGTTVMTALTVSNPKTRYTVTPAPIQNLMENILPKRVVDGMIARRLGLK